MGYTVIVKNKVTGEIVELKLKVFALSYNPELVIAPAFTPKFPSHSPKGDAPAQTMGVNAPENWFIKSFSTTEEALQ